MNIFAFIFIAGFIAKCILVLVKLLIYKLSLPNDTQLSALAINSTHVDNNKVTNTELKIETVSNSLKPLGKQIYMCAAS
jgi:hypothetical protein